VNVAARFPLVALITCASRVLAQGPDTLPAYPVLLAAPFYPPILREAGIQGTLEASFVVDTTGVVVLRTITIISAAHQLFVAPAREVLRTALFAPAVVAGRPIPQPVTHRFHFIIMDPPGDRTACRSAPSSVTVSCVAAVPATERWTIGIWSQ
jgi:TonB family protein